MASPRTNKKNKKNDEIENDEEMEINNPIIIEVDNIHLNRNDHGFSDEEEETEEEVEEE